ncbi:MAG: NAD-dependent epimerase/dehydratase family protein [Patescibacteria group bacterium]
MKIQKSRILVTGGTGLVGKPFVESVVASGATVYCITRKRVQSKHPRLHYLQCDLLRVAEKATKIIHIVKRVNALVYLAANIPPLTQRKETLFEAKQTTLDPFVTTLEHLGTITESIVLASTIDVHGPRVPRSFTELQAIAPATPYAVAKYCCEEYLRYYSRVTGTPHTVVRFSQVFGENEQLVRVIPYIVNAFVHNQPFRLIGSGKDERRYLFAEDAATAVRLALFHPKNETYQVAGKEVSSINRIIATLEKIISKTLTVIRTDTSRPPLHIVPNTNKVKRALMFSPRYSLEQGLRKVMESIT